MNAGHEPNRLDPCCVVGLAWGDEGKGKIVDLITAACDTVVRYNGGANAGHTVCVGDQRFALHQLPIGVLRTGISAVVGPGVVVDPDGLLGEIDALAQRGIAVGDNLKISDRAHLVMPYHKLEDRLGEQSAPQDDRIGTTARGIGPCYADKMRRRSAVRLGDMLDPDRIDTRVRRIVTERCAVLAAIYDQTDDLDPDAIVAALHTIRPRLAPYITDTTAYLHDRLKRGGRILFEGANGMLLDVDHGTFPFVTSSSTGPHGIGGGAGVPVTCLRRIVGVTKAYTTRVGSGPFVSELSGPVADRIRETGREYGTTTGRPRRCGWFDAVACRYSARIGGVTDVALMHLDTLAGFDRVGICVNYQRDGQTIDTPPADADTLERCKPVIEYLPGWDDSVRSARRRDDLPASARRFIERIETLLETPVSIISVGPKREQTLAEPPFDRLVQTA